MFFRAAFLPFLHGNCEKTAGLPGKRGPFSGKTTGKLSTARRADWKAGKKGPALNLELCLLFSIEDAGENVK